MTRTVWLYGLALALLLIVLRAVEYRFLVRDLRIEFYVGIVATLTLGLGLWIGSKVFNKKAIVQVVAEDEKKEDPEIGLQKLGISPREYEVLQLIAEGHSNQEIAERLFISLNTVKTHSSKLFAKLDVKRRTQAVQKAKELNLL